MRVVSAAQSRNAHFERMCAIRIHYLSPKRSRAMLKKIMITTALSTMMIGAAAAQTPPASTTTTPSATPAAPAATSAPAAGDAKFINAQTGDQWLSSNFIGVDVLGPDDEKIGDVSDILFDKSGNVVGYVVGVGGFLGIGAKNVALAPSSFQVMPASASSTATTGSASTARADDVKLKLNMTKDQLKQAAAFESKRDQDAKANRPATGAGGAAPATAPR